MTEFVQGLVVSALLFWLLSMLYVGPTYLRRLGSLMEHIKSQHQDLYQQLNRPSLSIRDSTIGGQISIVKFVLLKHYESLEDDTGQRLAKEARWRLLYSIAGVIPPTAIVILEATR